MAKATKKKPGSRKGAGRPSAFKPEYVKLAYNLALLGATDTDLARSLEVAESTIQNWKRSHPEFLVSIKKGRDVADGNVAKSLYRRALGYSHKAVKILAVARGNNLGSEIEEVPYIERYPPDTAAAIFWLKNRRKDDWRDKQDHEHTGKDGEALAIAVTHTVIDPADKQSAN